MEEWLDAFKKQKANKRIDKATLEKMIYASHLLEGIKTNELEFTFKGDDIRELNIENLDWNFFNPLKKQADKSSFYYWYKALEVMNLIN